jgi:hypothetical protein
MTNPIQIVGSTLRRGEVTTGRKGSTSRKNACEQEKDSLSTKGVGWEQGVESGDTG